MNFCIVTTTFADKKSAKVVANQILTKKLGACVQLSGIDSFYTWDGKIENQQEVMMVIKTKVALFDKLQNFLLKQHTYEVPEIIMLPIEKGSDGYFNWLNETLTDG